MKASERLLNTEYSLVVFKMVNGKIGVHFENCEVKDGYFLIGAFGRGILLKKLVKTISKEFKDRLLYLIFMEIEKK